jgi:hypothetical protein
MMGALNYHRLTAGGFGLRLKAGLIGHSADIAISPPPHEIPAGMLQNKWPAETIKGKDKSCRRLKAWGLPIPDRRLYSSGK